MNFFLLFRVLLSYIDKKDYFWKIQSSRPQKMFIKPLGLLTKFKHHKLTWQKKKIPSSQRNVPRKKISRQRHFNRAQNQPRNQSTASRIRKSVLVGENHLVYTSRGVKILCAIRAEISRSIGRQTTCNCERERIARNSFFFSTFLVTLLLVNTFCRAVSKVSAFF